MREVAYRQWLEAQQLKTSSVQTLMTDARRVERDESLDLDQEFDRDGIQDLVGRLTFSIADQRAGLPNPSKILLPAQNLWKSLRSYRNTVEKYRRFRESQELSPDDDLIDVEEDSSFQTFGLERDLQNVLRMNVGQLESGLEIIDGGSERTVATGRIDILAKDMNGVTVVIELKAGIAQRDAVSQTLGYIGSLMEEGHDKIRGILVAAGFDEKARLAAKATPTLTLKSYQFLFKFN
jgi:endonuclease